MAVREADNLVTNARPINSMLRSGGSVLRHSTFDWKVAEQISRTGQF